MERLLTTQQMKLCEKRSDESGVSLAELMDNAGEALARVVLDRCMKKGLKNCVILCGKGNNGGDGFVAARFLADSGMDVTVILCCGEPATELAKAAFGRLGGIRVISGSAEDTAYEIFGAQVLVDCIFGTGFKGALRDEIKPLFSGIQQSPAYKIACDIPSGCDADTGLCDEYSFRADITVTFHKAKIGMALSPAKDFCGEVIVRDIGIPAGCEATDFYTFEPDEVQLSKLLPSRPAGAHKGFFGKVLIIAGSENYYGAAAMAANAALRCGAGIVQLAAPRSVITALAGGMYECTFLPYDEGDSPDKLIDEIKTSSAVLIGCGMGQSKHTRHTLAAVIKAAECPLIIDADGLNCLAKDMGLLKNRKNETVLTPHIGELARLCGVDRDTALSKRLELAIGLSEEYGAVVVSKSAGTLITRRGSVIVSNYGNTALSKGGSGDMLAGMITSFAAQRRDCGEAAALGCYLLGKSAEILCCDLSERGVLARDILGQIPKTLKMLEDKKDKQ